MDLSNSERINLNIVEGHTEHKFQKLSLPRRQFYVGLVDARPKDSAEHLKTNYSLIKMSLVVFEMKAALNLLEKQILTLLYLPK